MFDDIPNGRVIESVFIQDQSWSSNIEKMWKHYQTTPLKVPNSRSKGGVLYKDLYLYIHRCFTILKENRGISILFEREDGYVSVFYHTPQDTIKEYHILADQYQRADIFLRKKSEIQGEGILYIVNILDTNIQK